MNSIPKGIVQVGYNMATWTYLTKGYLRSTYWLIL